MTETGAPSLVLESLLEYIKTLAWCKQDGEILVAVHNCSPELIVALSDREAKVYPGGTQIKINKSWLSALQEKNAAGTPVPALLVWKQLALEIWYRRQKSQDFPYDTWQNAGNDSQEKECVRISGSAFGDKFREYHQDVCSKAKACPSVIPQM